MPRPERFAGIGRALYPPSLRCYECGHDGCSAAGRRGPQDVAVVGFDDSGAASACRPPLTTVRQPVEDMAAEMAALLLDRLAVPDRPVNSVIFEPELVVRDST
ncbi:substrate-binding domain-containing protein [Streptomyces atroolivaceus]|uniref:substrate-binding domain-containing protein n=1 Tax=Streptomyces atroolivaceus TaxID=66869 RepID=UPI003666A824